MRLLKINSVIVLLLLFCSFGLTTEKNPVSWNYKAVKTKTGFDLVFTATIEKGWKLYSTKVSKEGPVNTEIKFEKNAVYTLDGAVQELSPKKKDAMWEKMEVKDAYAFEKTAVFKQKIKMRMTGSFKVRGKISGMCCDSKECMMLGPVPFEIAVKNN